LLKSLHRSLECITLAKEFNKLKHKTMTNLTTKELKVLKLIKEYQNENGHSDFLSTDAKSKSVAGTISSLEKKGLVYDSYKNILWNANEKKFKMWCLTPEATKIVGTPESWLY